MLTRLTSSSKTLFLVVALTVLSAVPGLAATKSNEGYVYGGRETCTWGSAVIQSDGQEIVFGGAVERHDWVGACGQKLGSAPGWLAQRFTLYHWNGQSWDICAESADWTFNEEPIVTMFSAGGIGGPVCGEGWYGIHNHSFGWDGNRWRGGAVWSFPVEVFWWRA